MFKVRTRPLSRVLSCWATPHRVGMRHKWASRSLGPERTEYDLSICRHDDPPYERGAKFAHDRVALEDISWLLGKEGRKGTFPGEGRGKGHQFCGPRSSCPDFHPHSTITDPSGMHICTQSLNENAQRPRALTGGGPDPTMT